MPPPKTTQLPLFADYTTADMSKYMKTLRGPFSQQEFAGVLETDASVVDNWERGISRPSPRLLRAALQHYARWAIQEQLPFAARQAEHAAGIKKHLTTLQTPDKKGA